MQKDGLFVLCPISVFPLQSILCLCCWIKGFEPLGWSWQIFAQRTPVLAQILHSCLYLQHYAAFACHFSQNRWVFTIYFFSSRPIPATVWVTSVRRGSSLLGAWLGSSTGQWPFHQMCSSPVSRPVSSSTPTLLLTLPPYWYNYSHFSYLFWNLSMEMIIIEPGVMTVLLQMWVFEGLCCFTSDTAV